MQSTPRNSAWESIGRLGSCESFQYVSPRNHLCSSSRSSKGSFSFKYFNTDSMDSARSTTSSAFDFLSEMCVELDDIESTWSSSPQVFGGNVFFPPTRSTPRAQDINDMNRDFQPNDVPKSPICSPRAAAVPPVIKNEVGDAEYAPQGDVASYKNVSSKPTVKTDLEPVGSCRVSIPESKKTIPLRLIESEDGVCLVPLNPEDTDMIRSICDESDQNLLVSVHRERSVVRKPERRVEDTMGNVEGQEDAPPLHPKHIYGTVCDTFRVQMSKGSKSNPNGKFSRNARSESDALWLCECALILIDCPGSLDEVVHNGNYHCMLQKGMVTSPEDFALKLKSNADDLSRRGVLRTHESERLAGILPIYLRHIDVQQEETTEGQSHFSRTLQSQSVLDKASESLAGWGMFLTGQQRGSFSNNERKKRRRVSKQNAKTKQPVKEEKCTSPLERQPEPQPEPNFDSSETQPVRNSLNLQRSNTADTYRQISPDWKSLCLRNRSQSSASGIPSHENFFESPADWNHVSEISRTTLV